MTRIVLVVSLSALGACSANSDTATPAPTDSADRQAAVTFEEAVATASAEVPDGVPYEVEMERLEGRDVIEVDFLVGAKVKEVYIDPATGDVLEVRDEAEENTEQSEAELQTQASLMSTAQVSLADAAQLGADHAGGEAQEVELKVIDGKLVAEVEVATADGATVVLIDAATGDVLESGPDAEEDEDAPEGE